MRNEVYFFFFYSLYAKYVDEIPSRLICRDKSAFKDCSSTLKNKPLMTLFVHLFGHNGIKSIR